MKIKKGSVKMLFLVLLWQATICSSNAAVLKSSKSVDVLKDNGEKDVSFRSKALTKKVLKDPLLLEDVSRLMASFAERTATVNENEANACRLGWEVFHQIYKPLASEWLVDDSMIQLLANDLQLLIDCTRPGERVVFSNTRTLKLARTVKITHRLEFIGKPPDTSECSHANFTIPSLTCPYSEPSLSVNATNFKATALSIKNCASSSASSKAAIVLEPGSSATLNQLTLKDNQNRAIYVYQTADLILTDSNLENNEVSSDGGAIYIEGHSTIHIHNSNFKRNFAAKRDGGAISFNSGNIIVIKNSTFTNNTCADDGGAIYLTYNNALHIQGSVFANSAAPYAGAISSFNGNTVVVEKSTFTNNISKYGAGAIFFYNDNTLSIHGSAFTNNTSATDGGALRLYDYNVLNIHESSFANNTSKGGSGGAVSIQSHNIVNVKESSFTNNTCEDNGGMMYLHENNTLNVQASMLLNNHAKKNGGAMYFGMNNTFIAYRSSLTNNLAMINGGALQLLDNNHAFLVGCTLSHNKATNGSVSNLEKDNVFNIERSSLSDNICTRYGSVLYLGTRNDVAGFDSFITNNQARQKIGQYDGAIYSTNSYNRVAFINSIVLGKLEEREWCNPSSL